MEEKRFTLSWDKPIKFTNEELMLDINRVFELSEGFLTQKIYSEHGKYDVTTISGRFGTWNKALELAGIAPNKIVNYSNEKLFENILRLWEHYGRQPRRSELAFIPSEISQSPYNLRFGGWINALEAFVEYANNSGANAPENTINATDTRGPRDPSLRLRFRILKRNNFSCKACGASPAMSPGLNLHIDHIVPWSLGGSTTEDNLQTLCEPCNLGKSNVF